MKVFKNIRISFKYLFDKNIKLRKKVFIILALIYLISPIDLVPDPVFGIGLIDDIVIFLAMIFTMRDKLQVYENSFNDDGIKDAKECKVIDLIEFNKDE